MSSKQSSPNRRPHYAILERDRKQRRTDRNIRLMRDTAPLARTGKSKSKKTQSLHFIEDHRKPTNLIHDYGISWGTNKSHRIP